eukprot:18149-Heterococcus_DN1.PRE.2
MIGIAGDCTYQLQRCLYDRHGATQDDKHKDICRQTVAFAIRIVHLPIAKIAASQNFGATELTYCAVCRRNSTINSKQTSCGARLVGEHHMRPVSEYYASADVNEATAMQCIPESE